jgi:MFS family permease
MSSDDVLGGPLRGHRPFALYWSARVSTTVALQMQTVAVSWQMYDLTNNPLDLGLVGLFHFIPAALLVLVAGHVADRYDRRAVVRTCQFVAGLAAAVLAAGTAGGWLTREAILGVVLVIGAARTFETTIMQTLVPAVVPLPLLARATAASSSATQLAVIAGPALGGLLYAVSPILVYALCCGLYIAAGLLIGLIRIQRQSIVREPISLATLFAGFAYIRRNRIVLGAISLDLFAVLVGGVTALLPVFARDVLGAGPWGLGLLRAAPGVGALVAAAVMTRWPLRRMVGRIMFGAVAMFGVAILLFALSRSFVLSMAALGLLGAADMVSVVIRMTLVQLETPDEMRGRVSAVNSLFVTASNQLGEFRAGLMAAWLGAIPAVLVGGVGALAVALIGRKIFAELYRVDALDPARREDLAKPPAR